MHLQHVREKGLLDQHRRRGHVGRGQNLLHHRQRLSREETVRHSQAHAHHGTKTFCLLMILLMLL